MPFESESQRRFMWANHPGIAEAWAHGRSSKTGEREPASRKAQRAGGHRGGSGGYRRLPRHKARRARRGGRG